MHKAAIALFFLFTPVAAFSQINESIEVNVVELDVVVVDAHNKPVAGLTRDDFVITVGGKPAEITNFYAVDRGVTAPLAPAETTTAAEPSPPIPPRKTYLIVFTDLVHLRQRGLKRSLDSLRQFLGPLPDTVSVMVVAWSGSLSIAKPFSGTTTIDEAIASLQKRPAQMLMYERRRRDLLHMIDDSRRGDGSRRDVPMLDPALVEKEVRHFVDQERDMTERTVDALGEIVHSSAGLDGRRVVVYLSDGLPLRPGAELLQYLGVGELDAQQYDVDRRLRRITESAAGAGVQFFAVDAGGLRGIEGAGADEEAHLGRLDSSLTRDNLRSTLQYLADETGGRAIIDRNSIGAAFAELGEHLTTYYSLGFRGDGTSRPRNVHVTTRRPGLTVRAAHTVTSRSSEEQIGDRVRAALYSREETNPLGARVAAKGEPGKIRIAVTVPVERLTLLPGMGGFDVQFALLTERLDESDVRTVHQDVRGPLAEQAISINARSGKYVLSIAIVDSLSKTASYMQREIVVP